MEYRGAGLSVDSSGEPWNYYGQVRARLQRRGGAIYSRGCSTHSRFILCSPQKRVRIQQGVTWDAAV